MNGDERPTPAELLTSDEVIERLKAETALRSRAVTCVLKAIKHGNEWRFRRSDLEAWIAQHLPLEAQNQPMPS